MDNTKSARVVIVDDTPEEVTPLIRALSRRQISTCWFSGDVAEFPAADNSLDQIRLAFLDIDLIGGGATNHAKLTSLVNVIKKLFAVSLRGYGIILWTKHPELAGQFVEMLLREQAVCPLFVIPIPKADCKNGAGIFSLDLIEKQLRKSLKGSLPWQVMWQWETDTIRATINLVNALADVCKPPTAPNTEPILKLYQKEWQKNISRLLLKLSEEELGSTAITRGKDVVRGLYLALAPMVTDGVESDAELAAVKLRADGKRIIRDAAGHGFAAGAIAKVNEKLGLAEVSSTPCLAGNVYGTVRQRGLRKAIPSLPSKSQVLEEIVKESAIPTVAADSELILIESSPVCDYAQDKVRQGRLVAGLFVKEASFPKIKSPLNVWSFGPIQRGGQTVFLIANFNRLYTCPLATLKTLKPIARLRQSVLVDMQSRFGAHATRTGLMVLKS